MANTKISDNIFIPNTTTHYSYSFAAAVRTDLIISSKLSLSFDIFQYVFDRLNQYLE